MKNLKENYNLVCKKIGYNFENENLLYQAFTRSSYAKENGLEDNETLEFIGDRILGLFITKMLTINYGYMTNDIGTVNKSWSKNGCFALAYNLKEGNVTELKNYLLSNKFLASRIEQLGFHKMLYLGKSDINNNVIDNEKVKADLLEAILGAVAIDSNWNYDKLEDVVYRLTDLFNNLLPISTDEIKKLPEYLKEVDPVTILKELAEKGRCNPPEYLYKELFDANNGHVWECRCVLKNCKTHKYWVDGPSVGTSNLVATAMANTKKEAKRKSANSVLNQFYVL